MESFDIEEFDKPDFNLVAWLESYGPELTQRLAAWIATRILARVTPVLMEELTSSALSIDVPLKLIFLRRLLTSGVGAYSLTPEIRQSAYDADMALTFSNMSHRGWVTDFAHSASLAVRTVNSWTGVGDSVIERSVQNANEAKKYVLAGVFDKFDTGVEVVKLGYPSPSMAQPIIDALCDQIQTDTKLAKDFYRLPLWAGKVPEWFLAADQQTQNAWASDPNDNWNFWTRWWHGVVTGKPLDWALQEKVALIPDDIWQQGAAAVARAIRDIEEAMTPPEPSDTDMEKVIEQTRHGAVLFYDPDTKLIGEEAVSTLPQDVRRDVVDLMQDVLSDLNNDRAGSNVYEQVRIERNIVQRALDDYVARPRMFLISLRNARAGVLDKIANDTCPPDNAGLKRFIRQMEEAQTLLMTYDAELADAVRNQERLPDVALTAEDLHLLTAGMQALQGHATPELRTAIEADLAAIADTNLPIPNRKAAMLSTIARVVQVRVIATGRGIQSVYGKTRFARAEIAGWARDLDAIYKLNALFDFAKWVWNLLGGLL